MQGELYQVGWRPALPGVFPPPPDPTKYIKQGAVAGGAAAPKAYQAPGSRAAGGTGRSLAELSGESGGGVSVEESGGGSFLCLSLRFHRR